MRRKQTGFKRTLLRIKSDATDGKHAFKASGSEFDIQVVSKLLTKKKELTPLEQAMMEALSPGWAKAQAAAAKQGTGGKGDEEEVWDWDPKKRGIKFK